MGLRYRTSNNYWQYHHEHVGTDKNKRKYWKVLAGYFHQCKMVRFRFAATYLVGL
eukprot:gene19284-6549_t